MKVIAYPFAAVPTAMMDEIDHPTAERLFKALYDCIRRGWVDPPIRYLMAQVKRSDTQVRRGLAILEASGRLRITRRKLGTRQNDTNLYEIPGLRPGRKRKSANSRRSLIAAHPGAENRQDKNRGGRNP